MFKAIGNLIYKTPWWGLILTGIALLAVLVMFTLPVHVIHLADSGATPAENRAIQREIGLAVGERALNLAKAALTAMKERTTDIERRREFDRALEEISRAREELVRAQNDVSDAVGRRARDAAESALETATEAAESALEAAVEAREAIEEAKADAIDRLRDRGVDVSGTLKSFEQLIATARENEHAARDALAAMRAVPHDGPVPPAIPGAPPVLTPPAVPVAPARPAPPAVPALPDAPFGTTSSERPPLSIGIHLPGGSPRLVLPPEVKGDIHAKVGADVWRVAVGSALLLAFIPLFVMLLIAKFFIGRSRSALALAERKTREAEMSDVSRQVTEARLQTLQAQVEPHFLYNTLANVQALNEVDPPAANQMVGHLIQYLRASLPKMRESTSTVGQELDLVRAYLNILQMRMGERLAFGINAPDDVLACAFAPMMLPSLVENAIKHGLEPLREGGRIDVLVERLQQNGDETLRVQVKDTGRGLSDTPTQSGGGVGLANLRERLTAIYGTRGSFTITSNEPKGTIATIEVPLQSSTAYLAAQPARTALADTPAPAAPAAASGWRRVWYATSKTHGMWARLLARLFMVLMVVLAGLLLIGFLGLLTGWLPVHMGDLQLDGIEGLALGSVGLLIGFGASALAVAIVVAVLYGLGFLFAALLVFIPAVILVSVFPFLAPFILIGLALWWVAGRRPT